MTRLMIDECYSELLGESCSSMEDVEESVHDVDMSQDILESQVQETISKWREKFSQNLLTKTDLEEYWKKWVPRIYTPSSYENCLNWTFDDLQAKTVLFGPLEEFICDGSPDEVLTLLSQEDRLSSVCGRVFKMGEATYSCRECGMDNTCVFCSDCFRHSTHRHHKYKMSTANGGGCCDCGDVEAWKKDPYCDLHAAGLTEEEKQKQGLPEVFKSRARIVYEAVLWYAYHLLSTHEVSNLKIGESSDDFFDIDSYCTILYNDEVHTFEQVISTLTRVLKCDHRNAIIFVTSIDREGRAVVKCSEFKHCNELRLEIEKYTSRHGNKPLKVIVSHSYIIAHQLYAMKLLTWLQNFLSHGEGFRSVFADAVLKRNASNPCIVEGILLRDSSLWKSARLQWHRLLISGMLLEYETKKELARIFTKNYGQVLKDFIRDDHDHSCSISSLSIQLFTVPTIAHFLIAEYDILYLLLNTFSSECSQKCNKFGKLEFERSPAIQTFKRALYILPDVSYLLAAIPVNWTDDLRRNFLHGLTRLLDLLVMMQGMDCVVRQVGQHMEYEPEWESAFNLHIKLAQCVTLVLKWCSTDKVVLIKAYRLTLKKLEENPCYETNERAEPRELADHSTSCLHYDVSVKPVSIHLPLSRFLAGLHIHLEQFSLSFDGEEFQAISKPTPVQIIEPVLRTQAMIAQVHAGMWRRNGYGLLNQLYFYHNVKCRSEMLDRDIALLQVGASLIESNEFIIHLLNKLNLINWANVDFEINSLKSPEEDSMRQTINLVEEFLQLMIVIIGERHMPGISKVTPEERIKKELIQQLCIKPLPHSELSKNIADSMYNTAIDDVIDELATFKKPSHGSGMGVYELKNEYYDNYNVFFYHYTREELSKSEENQRKRRAAAGQLECCPPPELPKLTESFSMIVNLLHCDVMLHIMQLILKRCMNLRARSFSEIQLHKVLHLIGYALQEEDSNNYPFFKFRENSAKFEIFSLLETLLTCPRVDAHKDLLKWTIIRFKPKDSSLSDDCSLANKEDIKAKRAQLAAEKRAKIMAQMNAMQKNFMKENAELFNETNVDLRTSGTFSGSAMDLTEYAEDQPIALGVNQTVKLSLDKTYTCILCQEEETVSVDGPTLVLAAFVQQATVLCQFRNTDDLMDITKYDPLYLHANLGPAPHTSTCGHVMHSDCWRKFFDNVMLKEHRRPYRLRHPASFDVDKQEFLCPLCECLSNTVLPLLPSLNILQPQDPPSIISFNNFVKCLSIIVQKKAKCCHGMYLCESSCKNLHCKACSKADNDPSADCETNSITEPHQVFYSLDYDEVSPFMGNNVEEFTKLFPKSFPDLNANLKDMVQVFAQVTYTRGLKVNPHLSDKRIALMTWKSLSYTIHSIEVINRESNKPLLGHLSSRHRDCLENLIRLSAILSSTWSKSAIIRSHAVNLLCKLIEHPNKGPSILQWDTVGFLIPLTFSLPSLSSKDSPTGAPLGGIRDSFLLRLLFISHVIRILILMDTSQFDPTMETESNDDVILTVLNIMNKINISNTHLVWQKVQEAALPFLRCCVLFYHYLTEVPAPSALTEVGGDTYANMCAYLDIPGNPTDLLDCPEVITLVEKWCNHEETSQYLTGTPYQVVYEPLAISHLIELPGDYSDLINTVSSFTCPKSEHEESRNPTMCLVCGEMLCSQSYCCQTEIDKMSLGACNYHAINCGAGVGIFLRIRECEILLLATPHRGCFLSAPYLDSYGETDQGLRRGNPLKLCIERYNKLQNMWLSHTVHEEIARAMETSSHIVTTQWHHL